ncbi:hypothetical protein C2U72_00035 [Prosthecomicrobium hirschii]|nr:hypothetical protein C2U72_00035 [Prosthecomicrobium hirschii]
MSPEPDRGLSADNAAEMRRQILGIEPSHPSKECPMDPIDTKPWWASRTIIGQAMQLISIVAGALLGIQVDPATQALVVDQVTAFACAAVTLVGTGITIWGRLRASRKIG